MAESYRFDAAAGPGTAPQLRGGIDGQTAGRTTKPRIAIFGNFGTGNIGNEATLSAMLGILHRTAPQSDVVCICLGPDAARSMHSVATRAIRLHRPPGLGKLGRLIRRLLDPLAIWRSTGGIDVLLVPGTALLEDTGERPTGMPLMLFTVCLCARLRGARVAFVSAGAGPIRSRLSRLLLKGAIGLAGHRSFRDVYSRTCMSSIGSNTCDDAVFPDLAYHLPLPAGCAHPSDGMPCAVIGVMHHLGDGRVGDGAKADFAAYADKLAVLGHLLMEQGIRVRLMIGEDKDQETAKRLFDRLSSDVRNVNGALVSYSSADSFQDLCADISDADVIVASRFHNVLAGFKMGIPTLSLGYSARHDELAARNGFEGHSFQLSTFSPHEVARTVAAILDDAALWRGLVARGCIEAQAAVVRHERRLEEYLTE